MKRLLSILWMTLLTAIATAQTDRVVYHQDPKITELIEAYKNYNRKNELSDGFRIQISFSNNRQEIYNSKARIYIDLPGEHCYVQYEQPYYKLRVGDFSDRFQAYQRLQTVLDKYPAAFIVRDKIRAR